MYASPIVLIFSTPFASARASKRVKTLSRHRYEVHGDIFSAIPVKADDVSEEHGRFVEALGDGSALRPSTGSAIRRREDV